MAASSSGDDPGPGDVFEIDDFTVVTPIEVLQSQLEMVLHDWGVTKNSSHHGNFLIPKGSAGSLRWDCVSETVKLGENEVLTLSYFSPKDLSLDSTNDDCSEQFIPQDEARASGYLSSTSKMLTKADLDFCPGSIIANQFGVVEYVVLTSRSDRGDIISSENQLQTVLSAVTSALSSSGCELPLFVQFGPFERQLFVGVAQNRSMRTLFQTVHLHHAQPSHSHLAGLLELFTNIVGDPFPEKLKISVSVMVEYVLQEAVDLTPHFATSLTDLEGDPPKDLVIGDTYLPFGATADVLKEICLCAIWPNLSADVLIEDGVHSDLEPMTAPFWASCCSFENGVPCALHTTLKTLRSTSESDQGKQLVYHVAGVREDESSASIHALSALAHPQTISISNPAGVAYDKTGLLPETVFRWIDVIFMKGNIRSSLNDESLVSSTDEGGDTSAYPGYAVKKVARKEDVNSTSVRQKVAPLRDGKETSEEFLESSLARLNDCKAAPFESLTARIATALTRVLSLHESGVTAFAQLWIAIVTELRNHWETNRLLPGFDEHSPPDHGTCLLHQKLQMLQCCIVSRIKQHRAFDASDALTDADEEFHDAKQWLSEESLADTESVSGATWQAEDGRRRLLNFCLLNSPETPAWEPWTQDRCPLTEDMLEKQTDYISTLDTQEARAEAQIDGMRSDMQAFKAANPGCCFEDFIRWFSEKDFIIDEATRKVSLSPRMSRENNLWMETFRSVTPRAAHKQARLFNESKEAESILQEFERLSVSSLIHLITPVVLKCAAKQLVEEAAEWKILMESKLTSFYGKVAFCSRSASSETYLDALRELLIIETTISQCSALWSRFNTADEALAESVESSEEVREFVSRLVEKSKQQPEVCALNGTNIGARFIVPVEHGVNGATGRALRKLFMTDARLSDVASGSLAERFARGGRSSERKNLVSAAAMPPYNRRQYVLRTTAQRPGTNSRFTPSRMYASMSNDEFRIGLAISEDTVIL